MTDCHPGGWVGTWPVPESEPEPREVQDSNASQLHNLEVLTGSSSVDISARG